MPKNIAPPKVTGGGGFAFEDKVVAYFLAAMLANVPPLDVGLGLLERLDFQTRPDGWYLDDLLLTLRMDQDRHCCALSIKSNVQFSEHAAPQDFVTAVWEQYLHKGSAAFNAATDYMGLITTPLPPAIKDDLDNLLAKASTNDTDLLPTRYQEPSWARESERKLCKSFACPDGLALPDGVREMDIGRLVARLRFLQSDFEATPSLWERDAVVSCRTALVSGNLGDAVALWESLLVLAAEYRPQSGYLTREILLDRLRIRHRFAERPDHRHDWARLAEITHQMMDQVSTTIGQIVTLDRTPEIDKLDMALEDARGVVLLSPSGIGKSAVVKLWATAHKEKYPHAQVVWINAESLEQTGFHLFESPLHLTHALADLLSAVACERATLVIDGVDRVYAAALANVATLIRMIDLTREGGPWRVILTCQTEEWPRVGGRLLQANVPVHEWLLPECLPVQLEDLAPVWAAFPSAAGLVLQRRLVPLLPKLKILDLIAVQVLQGSAVDIGAWIGESSVAEWFWADEVEIPPNALQRSRLVRLLAQKQADELRSSIPTDFIPAAELLPLDDLIASRICRKIGDGRVTFDHDLYGDWARLHMLMGQSESLIDYLADRLNSPLWHRAIRLYGLHLIARDRDLLLWRTAFETFREDQGATVACDLLLDSLTFSPDPLPLLEKVHRDLFDHDGHLLRRLLGRFLHSATVPDHRLVDIISSGGHMQALAAATNRMPSASYWPPLLHFLHAHGDDAVSSAPVETGRVVQMWLDHTPPTALVGRPTDSWPYAIPGRG